MHANPKGASARSVPKGTSPLAVTWTKVPPNRGPILGSMAVILANNLESKNVNSLLLEVNATPSKDISSGTARSVGPFTLVLRAGNAPRNSSSASSTAGDVQRNTELLRPCAGTAVPPKAHLASPRSIKPVPPDRRTMTSVPPWCGPP
jgi:hypothetical protein